MPATYMLRLMSYFLGRLNTLGGPLVILKESVFRLTNFIGFFVMVM